MYLYSLLADCRHRWALCYKRINFYKHEDSYFLQAPFVLCMVRTWLDSRQSGFWWLTQNIFNWDMRTNEFSALNRPHTQPFTYRPRTQGHGLYGDFRSNVSPSKGWSSILWQLRTQFSVTALWVVSQLMLLTVQECKTNRSCFLGTREANTVWGVFISFFLILLWKWSRKKS